MSGEGSSSDDDDIPSLESVSSAEVRAGPRPDDPRGGFRWEDEIVKEDAGRARTHVPPSVFVLGFRACVRVCVCACVCVCVHAPYDSYSKSRASI